MITNYCQEIQYFKTNFSTVIKHAIFLNELIPTSIRIDERSILGVKKKIGDLEQAELTKNKEKLTSENDSNNIKENQSLQKQPALMTSLTNQSEQKPTLETKPHSSFNPEMPVLDESMTDAGTLSREQTSNLTPTNVNTNSPSFIGQNNDQDRDLPEQSIQTSNESGTSVIDQRGGGFFDIISSFFGGNNNDISKKKEVTHLESRKDDYQMWKDTILPQLGSQNLNIQVSHGKFIKNCVLNNTSSQSVFKVDNLDGYLLEYNISNGLVSSINLLNENLEATSLNTDTSNITIEPTIGKRKRDEFIWKKITSGSTLPPEKIEQYSKCFLK